MIKKVMEEVNKRYCDLCEEESIGQCVNCERDICKNCAGSEYCKYICKECAEIANPFVEKETEFWLKSIEVQEKKKKALKKFKEGLK